MPNRTTAEAIGKHTTQPNGGLNHYLQLHEAYEKQRTGARISLLEKELKAKARRTKETVASEMRDKFQSLDYRQVFGPGGIAKYRAERDKYQKMGRKVSFNPRKQAFQGAEASPMPPTDRTEVTQLGIPRMPRNHAKMAKSLNDASAAGAQEVAEQTLTDNQR